MSKKVRQSKPNSTSTHNKVSAAVDGQVIQSGKHVGDIYLQLPSGRLPIPRQLPAAPSWFTGREEELAKLSEIVNQATPPGNSIVISAVGGTGGIGKTWLGLHWAHQNIASFPDGQLFVNLRGFDPIASPTTPATAVRGFLDAFEVAVNRIPADLEPQIGLYRSLVSDRRMLIFLDNAFDAEQVLPLLPGSSSCTVIITSRRQLTSLVTAHNAHPVHLGALPNSAARNLLSLRVGAKRIEAEPDAAVELADYCAGLPLALGIVAARAVTSPGLSLVNLAGELRTRESRLAAFDGGDDRSSLRAVFSWSLRALRPPTAQIFCMLGLVPGPDFSLHAASNLASEPAIKVDQALQELERASLVHRHVSGRWRMHDLVKLYAAKEAEDTLASEIRSTGLEDLVEFYMHSAYTADRLINPRRPPIQITDPPRHLQLISLPDKESANAWLEAEHICLMATLKLAQQHGWHYAVWRLAWALDTFHYRRGLLNDRIETLQAGLHAAQRSKDRDGTFMAHRLLGHAYTRTRCHKDAVDHLDKALAIAKAASDPLNEAHTHTFFVKTWGQQGDDERALRHAKRALDLFQLYDNTAWVIQSLNFVGWHSARLGRHEEAMKHCSRALNLSRQHGDRQGEAEALNSCGYLAQLKNDFREAIDYYLLALDVFHDLGHDYYEADVLDRIGEAYDSLGEHAPAQRNWQLALTLYRKQQRIMEIDRVLSRIAKRTD